MPRKIRELVKDLLDAGFIETKGGKGSHRKFVHPKVKGYALLSGNAGRDAKAYHERHIREKIRESKS